jgi:RNA polymerase sigma-70 factor (ECF subfamily)
MDAVSSPARAEPADEVLVEQLRRGDAAAGQMLVRRHHTALMRYLERAGGGLHAAEDLHQQTWLSVLDHLDRFDPRASGGFRAWLFRIATNKVHDRWRRRGREKAMHAGLRLSSMQTSPSPADGLIEAEQRRRLLDAVQRLPDPQREVVLLRHYGGLRFSQIAELLGCPLNTALGRMHKALLKLRRAMDEPTG